MSACQTLATALGYLVSGESTKQYLLRLLDDVGEDLRALEDRCDMLRGQITASDGLLGRANETIGLLESERDGLLKLIHDMEAQNEKKYQEDFDICLTRAGRDHKIPAIKEIRASMGLSLTDAKKLCEDLKQQGCIKIQGVRREFDGNQYVTVHEPAR
jgi:ribosomal protein L7/L12